MRRRLGPSGTKPIPTLLGVEVDSGEEHGAARRTSNDWDHQCSWLTTPPPKADRKRDMHFTLPAGLPQDPHRHLCAPPLTVRNLCLPPGGKSFLGLWQHLHEAT